MANSTVINFSKPAKGDGAALLLEQIPWDCYIGKVTKGAMVGYLKSMMYGYDEPTGAVDCGIVDDAWSGVLMAYPRNPALIYTLGLSHGEVSEGVKQEIDFTELVNFKTSGTTNLKYFSQGLVDAEFFGNCYDTEGSIIANPEIVVDGNTVTLPAVVGRAVLRITYKLVAFGHTVTVPLREESVENKYSSVAFAYFDGGEVHEKLDPPPDADLYNQNCGWSTTYSLEDEPACLPVPTYEDKYSQIDYCSGEEDPEKEKLETHEDPDYVC